MKVWHVFTTHDHWINLVNPKVNNRDLAVSSVKSKNVTYE